MEKIGDKTVKELAQMEVDEIKSWYDNKTPKTKKEIDKKFRAMIRKYDNMSWLDVLIELRKRGRIPSYWKIGFTYRGGNVWNEFTDHDIISIGEWDRSSKPFTVFSEDIKKGDKVVAYGYGEIRGICEVVGNKVEYRRKLDFQNTRKVKWLNILFERVPSDKLSDRTRKKLKRYGTFVFLSKEEFCEIEKKVKESEREWKGHPVCKIITHILINESGVIFLFGRYFKELGFEKLDRIERQRHRKFPDATVIKNGKSKKVEFETRSSNAKEHGKKLEKECELIICWENDWKDCPIEVLELRSEIKKL